MATFHDRTNAPKFQGRLLRGGGAPCRVLTNDQVLAEIEAEFAGLITQPGPEMPPEPLLSAAEARAIHSRRRLLQAFERGFDVLDALGLAPAALAAVDTAIAALDEADAATEDLEEGGDDEPSLGAPERSPYAITLTAPYYHPAQGKRMVRCFATSHCNQTRWAQGTGLDGEREAEAGYDLPEGDGGKHGEDDDDGLSKGEHDTADAEGSLGWPNDFTAVVADVASHCVDLEEVNEDGDDCGEAHAPWWDRIGYERAEGVHA